MSDDGRDGTRMPESSCGIGVAWKAGRGLRSMDDERVVRNYRNLGETTVDNLGDGETTVTSTSPVVQ